MQVILIENIMKLGKIGDQVEVKNGFARNYLLRQGKALRASKKNIEFVNVYNEYKSKGLEVIGVALDMNEQKWKSEIENNNFNWINVSQFKNYNSPVCMDYKINKTPSYFIMDREMKIVLKPKSKGEIMSFLKANL